MLWWLKWTFGRRCLQSGITACSQVHVFEMYCFHITLHIPTSAGAAKLKQWTGQSNSEATGMARSSVLSFAASSPQNFRSQWRPSLFLVLFSPLFFFYFLKPPVTLHVYSTVSCSWGQLRYKACCSRPTSPLREKTRASAYRVAITSQHVTESCVQCHEFGGHDVSYAAYGGSSGPGCVRRNLRTAVSLVLGLVAFHVQGQMIGAGEAALAHLAAEGLGAGVFSYVTGQLVGAGEAPLARREVTRVRLFTCNTQQQETVRTQNIWQECSSP